MKNILVVDLQKGFINQNNKHIVEKIKEYICQKQTTNIFFTQCVNDDESPFVKILKWNGITNKEDQEFCFEIPKEAKIIKKNCYGLSKEDIQLFKDFGITEMEICGTDTDACCLAIAFNLFDNNIKPIILSDLCASSSKNKDIHNNALEMMKRQFGRENVK